MQTVVESGQNALVEAAKIINNGGIVAFPTETVYGLGASAFNSDAIKKIFEAKGRPSDNPLIVHVFDKVQIAQLTNEISPQAQLAIDAFMPGPITIILKKSGKVDDCITAGLDTVGIRIPINEIAREFIKICGVPIVAPSANTSTKISPTNAQHVYEDLQGKIPYIIDGGQCDVGIESTIIDLSTSIPTILRPGAITSEMLAKVLGKVIDFKGEVVVAKAPGMKYKHYAPKCTMVVCDDVNKAICEYEAKHSNGKNPIILCSSEWAKLLKCNKHIDLGASSSQIAHNIYDCMHTAESVADYIICQDFGTKGVLGAVMNRMNKASAGIKI